MYGSFTMHLVYLAAITLLPLIPAYILYRVMPADAEAHGSFRGLKFKLGGAFAGYFVLVLALIYLPEQPIHDNERVWTLYADISFEGEGGSHSTLTVSTIPRNPVTARDGRMVYKTVGTRDGNEWTFPDLIIGHRNFLSEEIFLDPVNRRRDNIELDTDSKHI